MTIEQLFGNDQSYVSEDHFEKVFGSLHEGTLAGEANECGVIASAAPAMTVEVRTGTFVTGGCFARVSAQDVLIIPVADGANPRIDRVVCRRDNATNLVTVYVLAGAPAGAPVPTALTRAGGIYEISLAQVYVAAAVVVINTADITDERFDKSVCGWAGSRKAHETIVRKTADEIVNNSAVLQNDDELLFPIAVDETWVAEFFVHWTTSLLADINFGVAVPVGATIRGAVAKQVSVVAGNPTYHGINAGAPGQSRDIIADAGGAAAIRATHIFVTVVNGAAPGNVTLMWAQLGADPVNTTVYTNSYLKAERIG